MPLPDKRADRIFDAMLVKLERRLSRKILANFNKLSKLIREVIANGGEFAGNVVILENQSNLREILIQAYEEAIRESVKFTRMDLDLEEPEEDDYLAILLLLLGWVAITAEQHAEYLTTTSIDIFNRTYQEQTELGKTGKDLEKTVAREVAKTNRNRVGTIASTESNTAFQTGAEKTGVEVESGNQAGVKLLKSWRSQQDRLVRDSHARANSRYKREPIPTNEFFLVGAGKGMRPLDPILPMAERIGCRCYIRFVRPKS